MAEIIGWLVAGAAAIIAALFGGAWIHERKQKARVGADYTDLTKQSIKQKLKIRELVIRAEEQARIRDASRQGIEDMADDARDGDSCADAFARRIRGDSGGGEGSSD